MLPDVRDGSGAGSAAGMGEAIQIFQRAQDIKVINGLCKLPLLDHGPNEDSRNLVVAGVVIFVPGHNQKAVVGLGKLHKAIDVLLQPCIALRNRAVMHVVIEIRNHERESRQRAEICGETGKRLVGSCGNIAEIDPRAMLSRIGSRGAHSGTRGGQVLRETSKGQSRCHQFRGQILR